MERGRPMAFPPLDPELRDSIRNRLRPCRICRPLKRWSRGATGAPKGLPRVTRQLRAPPRPPLKNIIVPIALRYLGSIAVIAERAARAVRACTESSVLIPGCWGVRAVEFIMTAPLSE